MDPETKASIRRWALDRAITEAPGGTPWPSIIRLANTFAEYITEGTIPADEPKPDADPIDAHEFVSDRRRPVPSCMKCGLYRGIGNHL